MNTKSCANSRGRWACWVVIGCLVASHATASEPPQRRELFAQSGSIVPARPVQVAATLSGRVTRIRAAVGDVVKAGAILAELDDTRAKLVTELAQAKVELAKARYQAIKAGLAEKDWQQSPGKERLGVAEMEIKTSEAEFRLARHDLDAM